MFILFAIYFNFLKVGFPNEWNDTNHIVDLPDVGSGEAQHLW